MLSFICASVLLLASDGTVLGQAAQLTLDTIAATPCNGGDASAVAYVQIGEHVYRVTPGEVVVLP